MIKIERCNTKDYATLVEIWERSVRATHTFLSESDIIQIKESLIRYIFKQLISMQSLMTTLLRFYRIIRAEYRDAVY